MQYFKLCQNTENLERFLYFSTDEVFGPAPDGIKYSENDRYNSTNPYSATKAGGEELAAVFENTYNLPIYIAHTMNVLAKTKYPENSFQNVSVQSVMVKQLQFIVIQQNYSGL